MKILSLVSYFIIATLLTSVSPFTGLFLPILLIFSVAVLTAMSVKWSWVYSLFSATFSGIIIFLLFDSLLISLIFPLISLLSSMGIFIALKSKASLKTVVLSGTLAYLALIVGVYFTLGGSFISDILNIAKTYMLETLDSVAQSVPVGSDDAIIQMKQAYELYFENLKILAPSIILSAFFLISYLSIKLSSHFAKGTSVFEKIPSFSQLHAPTFLLIIGVISYVGQLVKYPFVSGLLSNIFMALSVYYTLCGFSIIDFFTKLRIKSIIARVSIYIVSVIVLAFVSVVFYFANPILIAMFAGILDCVFNYRARIIFVERK